MIIPAHFSRILLIRRKALGDALVTMRAVLEVVDTWPTASVDLVIDRPFAGLLAEMVEGYGEQDRLRVVAWPPPAGQSWVRFLRGGRYDLVIDWLGSPRTALWTMLTGAAVRVGYDLPRRRWAYNVKVPRNRSAERDLRGFAGEAFLDPLRSLGAEPAPWRDGFADGRPAEEEPRSGEGRIGLWVDRWTRKSGPRVVMMMSATWSTKGWPARHIADLFLGMRRSEFNPVFVAGPQDEALEAELRTLLPEDAFAPPTTLPELAALLEEASIFVGTDCGPRHLAASLGVPTVTLFGPTDPVGWNPASPVHVSVRTGVECSPCDLTECPVPGRPCLTELAPGLVMAAVERVLGAGAS